MSRTVKPEFQEGGARRQEILDKAVKYILDPKFGTQNAKHAFHPAQARKGLAK